MYEPLFRHRPSHRWTNGDLAAAVGADIGLPPDDEQKWILDSIYAEKSNDKPASFEVAVISPRQNIKTSTLGIAALADLFVFGIERQIWSAHLLDTARSTFADFRAWISSNHEYDDQVAYYEGHQDMAIVRKDNGARIEFRSRTGKGGRGLTGVKRITLDEALFLEAKHIGAVYPTMLTRTGAQVRIGSSAGLEASDQLRRIRDRGRTGKDNRLAYVEYGAERKQCAEKTCSHAVGAEGCALDNRELWWQANCALWPGRIVEESIEDMRKSMPPAEFMREFLSWWEDPVSVGGALPYQVWMNLADPGAERGPTPVFGLDLTGDRDVWISVAWEREDGSAQVMLANGGLPVAAYAAVAECKRLQGEWGGVFRTAALGDELEKAGVLYEAMAGTDFAAACGAFEDAINHGTVHHGNQAALNDAVRAARWRPMGVNGERAFVLKDCPEVGPAAAAARALSRVGSAASIYETRGVVVL